MAILRIDSPDDERLADYRNVPDAELLERRGVFVAEGRLVVRRLAASERLGTRSVMVTDTALASLQDVLDPLDVPVFVVPQRVMDGITGFNLHRGCLAIGERPAACDWRSLVAGARRVLVLERIGNADNMGAIFRNAAAFDVGAVLLGPGCVDPLYRKAIRTSMAAALSVPFASMAPWPSALHDLAAAGFTVTGLTPASEALPLHRMASDLAHRPAAFVLGHEGEGLTVEALAACTHRARIVTSNRVDSLNVGTAAAIALYELSRDTA